MRNARYVVCKDCYIRYQGGGSIFESAAGIFERRDFHSDGQVHRECPRACIRFSVFVWKARRQLEEIRVVIWREIRTELGRKTTHSFCNY